MTKRVGAMTELILGLALAALLSLIAWIYQRDYSEEKEFRREQKEFRKYVYETLADQDKRLSRNCEITEEVREVLRERNQIRV